MNLRSWTILTFSILLFLTTTCSDDGGTEPTNHAPVIQSITANPSFIQPNETTNLTCLATDEDGDNLTYIWESVNGSFPNGSSGLSVQWTAPNTEGTFNVMVSVSDVQVIIDDSINIAVQWPPCPSIQTVTYEGKTYNTVQIGNQCWLKENLDVGTMKNSTSSGQLQTDNGVIEKYCYNSIESNCDTYGGLYEWNETMQYTTTEGAQGICPNGWHIPTGAEIQTLATYANNKAAKLVAVEQPATGYTPTNETGFSALFAGYRNYDNGDFGNLGSDTYFWSSTESYSNSAWGMYLNYNYVTVYFYSYSGNYGFSVRCLQD